MTCAMSLLSTSTPSSRRKSSIHRMKSQLTQVLADDAVARKALTPLADCNSPVAESPHHAVVKSPTRQQQAMNTPAFVEHATPAPEAAALDSGTRRGPEATCDNTSCGADC